MEYFYLEQIKSKNVMCQIRTEKTQPFMFFNGYYIIKGPYTENQYNNIIQRSEILKKLKATNIIHPINHFVTPHGIFMRFHNFLSNYQEETVFYKEPFSRESYNVLKNSQVITMRQLLITNTNTWIFSHVKDLITTLCYCYILNIQKIDIDNIYVNIKTKQIYIIDYESSLTNNIERDDEIFYFNKTSDELHNWYNNCKDYYTNVIDKLQSLLNEEIIIVNNLEERTHKTINLLRNFVVKSKITTPKIFKTLNNKLDIHSPYKNCNDYNGVYFYSNNKYLRLSNYLDENTYLFKNYDGKFMSVQHAYQYYKFNYLGSNTYTLEYKDIILNNGKFCEFIGKKRQIPDLSCYFDVFNSEKILSSDNIQNSPYLKCTLRVPKSPFNEKKIIPLFLRPNNDKKEDSVIKNKFFVQVLVLLIYENQHYLSVYNLYE